MEITEAAAKARPGTAWNLRGDKLEQADDGTPRVSVPTMAELQPLLDSDLYTQQRLKAYPSIGDQLDALWKGGTAMTDMQKQITAIKAQFPKPS